jgi:hypothetical protein
MCCFSAAIGKKTSPVTDGGLLAPLLRLRGSSQTRCAELMTGPLQHLVSSRSWGWLRALCSPMSLDVQLLDMAYVPVTLFPARPGAPKGPLDQDAFRRLRPAAEAVVTQEAPQIARLTAHAVTLSPVRVGGAMGGVMLVAHPDAESAGADRRHLATVSGWLRAAVEQHLANHAVGADHLSALHHALRAAALDGSDRRLVSVFAEALAVWHDVEVVGYVETAAGVFTRAVSLAGRSGDLPPLVFPPQAVPAPQLLTRMPQTHVDDGDRSAADALVVTLTRGAGATWLLTLSGEIDACDPALLSGYVSALDITLALTARAASARVALAVASDLAAAPHDPQQALERALSQVRHSLSASAARFSARTAAGASSIAARSSGAATAPSPGEPRLVIERKTPALGQFALEIERVVASPWTPVEHAQARAAADVLERWAERGAPMHAPASPPPPATNAFAASIDGRVARALERNESISLVVLACSPSPTEAQAAALIAEARRLLREGDDAGILPDGDVGIVLAQTTAAQAPVVTRRLRAALSRVASAAGITIAAEGFATRMPGQAAGGSLLDDARPRDGSGPARA